MPSLRRTLPKVSVPLISLAGLLVAIPDADAKPSKPAKPRITSVSYAAGPTVGGSRVTVHGTGFTHVTGVTFAGVRAKAVDVIGPHKISLVTPVHAAGTTDVRVSTAHGRSAVVRADHFVYRQSDLVAAGDAHSCDVRFGLNGVPSGVVSCWGDNASGQLGTGNHDGSPVPVFSGHALSVSAGDDHTCSLDAAGNVFCWGNNAGGQLGDGSTTERTSAVKVAGLDRVIAFDAGYRHTCAVRENHSVWCWGANFAGQLGIGSRDPSPTPVRVSGISSAVSVSAGFEHTCAVLADGRLKCWGGNESGELGNSKVTYGSTTPITVRGAPFRSVNAGHLITCATHRDGAVSCWGDNTHGQLGWGKTREFNDFPVRVPGMSMGTAASTGDAFSCALNDGNIFCWGDRSQSQLGDASDPSDVPQRTATAVLTGWATQIASSGAHSCLVRRGHTPTDPPTAFNFSTYCWGDNSSGQLGDGTNEDRNVPVAVTSPGH